MPPPWGGCTTPAGDVSSALLPTYPGGVPLLPGPMLLIWISSREDFLSTSMGEHVRDSSSSQEPQRSCSLPQLGEPSPSCSSVTQGHHRTHSASPKKPSKAQTEGSDGQESHQRPILLALFEQRWLPGKPKLKSREGTNTNCPEYPQGRRMMAGTAAEGKYIPVFWFLSIRGKVLSSKELPPWVREALLRFTYSNRQ